MRKHSGWSNLSASQRNANLIAHALTLPQCFGADLRLSGTVYITDPDGDASVIIDNRGGNGVPPPGFAPLPQPGAASPPSPDAGLAAARGARADPPNRLPQSIDAVCAYGLQSHIFPDSTPQVAAWLAAAGYTVQRYSPPTVDDILGWSGKHIGVIFWQIHAGSLGADDGSHVMCIPTGQVATPRSSRPLQFHAHGPAVGTPPRGDAGLRQPRQRGRHSHSVHHAQLHHPPP